MCVSACAIRRLIPSYPLPGQVGEWEGEAVFAFLYSRAFSGSRGGMDGAIERRERRFPGDCAASAKGRSRRRLQQSGNRNQRKPKSLVVTAFPIPFPRRTPHFLTAARRQAFPLIPFAFPRRNGSAPFIAAWGEVATA
ncbi:hypothetical protein MTO96_015056 [Rhipicephalus appendiculatus]